MIIRVTFALLLTLGIVSLGRAQLFNPPTFFPTASGGSVTLDTCGTEAHSGGATSFNFSGITVGAALSKGALVAALNFNATTVSAISATWDSGGANQAMTQIATVTASGGAHGTAQLWGLINPTSGNKTLAVSWTTTTNLSIDACSWTGVNQTFATAFGSGFTNTNAGSGTASVSVTSATNHAVMAVHTIGNSLQSISSVNNAQIYIDNTSANGNAANRASGAASVSMTATLSASAPWGSVGTDISF